MDILLPDFLFQARPAKLLLSQMESPTRYLWIFFCFQHTFSSLLKQKAVRTSPPKPRATMAVSMRDVDPAFQGAGQKEYPLVAAYFVTGLHKPFHFFPLLFYPMNIIYLHVSLLSHTFDD